VTVHQKLTITALNTRAGVAISSEGKTLTGDIVSVAREYDVCGLNEVLWHERTATVPTFAWSSVRKNEPGPYHLTLGNEIQEQLTATHHLFFAPNFTYQALHDRAPTSMPVWFGNLLLIKKSRFPNHQTTTHFCYGTGNLNSETVIEGKVVSGLPASRSVIVTTLHISAGYTVDIVFLHGLWTQKGKVDCPQRVAQNLYIQRAVAKHRRIHDCTSVGTVIIGDLNYTSKLKCFTDLCENISIFGGIGQNLNHIWGITDTRTAFYTRTEREADFVIVSESLIDHVNNFDAVDDIPSDHKRLLLDLRF